MDEAEHLAHRIMVIDTGKVIAEGTAGELKERLGGDVLEARVHDRADLGRAAQVLAAFDAKPPRTDPEQQTVGVPVSGGATDLIEAGRRFEAEGIALDDLGIHRPSLDDVFLALTGAKTGEADRVGAS